ncbi:MAG: hypothetical protein CVU69_05935 [Deltaproteobacteria bacterium HGW-Deltaproteobacteria-4]|nr:MAG: hypothetical protein CVU69_05935 [Deltaproteobacteria bacterium HGW-Deltaproteobacteria-4]
MLIKPHQISLSTKSRTPIHRGAPLHYVSNIEIVILRGEEQEKIASLEKIAGVRSCNQNSAYYLDFNYKDSQNWAANHDLRIEHRGRVAQIDHLLINRLLDIFVLESKNY